MSRDHAYRTALRWRGSTAAGYEDYDRTHAIELPPSREVLEVTADPAFRGSPELTNPEQLLLAAASSCQLLSFLAIAARSGVEVLGYDDEASAIMPGDSQPMRITAITLRPRIVVAAGTSQERVLRIVAKAHDSCYIANSVNSDITIELRIDVVAARVD